MIRPGPQTQIQNPGQNKMAEGVIPLPADNHCQHPQLLFPHSRSSTIMIQQLSPLPQLLPHPLPHPLFPHRHRRMMIQRILQQELLFPQESPHPLLLHPLSHPQLLLLPHPHPQPQVHPPLSSHPQFVAAKSLILNPPVFLYTPIICTGRKSVTVYSVLSNVLRIRIANW